jgi:hypothetical protein
MAGRLGNFLEVFDLGLKILKVLLLPFPECSLCGSILGLAFLHITYVSQELQRHGIIYRGRFRCQWLPSWLLGRLIIAFSSLPSTFIVICLAVDALSLIV